MFMIMIRKNRIEQIRIKSKIKIKKFNQIRVIIGIRALKIRIILIMILKNIKKAK